MNHRLTLTAAAATVATSVALYPLVSTSTWFWEGTGAALVVAGTGTVTRLRRIPVAVCLAAGVAALLLYLNLLFASATSAGGLLPTRTSLYHLWVLGQRGLASVHRYAPPVPAGHGILLLAAGGIGIIAVVADLLAVRLRRPALAGLPLLVLFCVPLSTSAPPGPVGAAIVFGLAVAGYLALLSADGRERVRLWGRLVSVWHTSRADGMPETRKLAAAGRRIGFAAAALAVFLPLLLPGRPAHRLLGGSGTGGTGSRAGTVYLPDPLAVLNRQLHESRARTVLTYRTGDATPPYLQVYVLGQLGDNAWTLGRDTYAANVPVATGRRLPAPPGLTAGMPGPAVQERISLAGSLATSRPGLSYLPVPYPARSITVPGNWRVDRGSLTMFSPGARLSGLLYTVTAKDVNPSPGQLRQAASPPAPVLGYLPVPRAFSGLLTLAKRVTRGRDTSYGRAVALQRWFTQTGGFTYSLNVPQPRTANALIDFLTRSRRGYCQQFAFGMAVLARLLGIPSRVVVGYTQGTFVGGTLWRVTTRDAHAWPELYFQGAGWLRFEPTPDGSNGPGQATASAPGYSFTPTPGTVAPSTPAPTVPGSGATPGAAGQSGTGALRARSLLGETGSHAGGAQHRSPSFPAGWLALGVLGVMLVTPRSARSVTRRRRWLAADDGARADAAWREFTDDLTDHGIGCRPSESPRQVSRRLAGIMDLSAAERAALGRLVSAVERARYAREPVPAPGLRADVTLLRRAVARGSTGTARWQARLVPASALAPYRAGLQQALDVFGWLDRLTARAGRLAAWELPAGARRRAG
ncbi:MAG: DUF3488 and DUF4129 domain-containing transglutaminase family protein [Gemmatimonadota bacterium]